VRDGFITPPPGLLPDAPSVDAPRREQVPAAPALPSFTPRHPGAARPAAESTIAKAPPASVAEPRWSLQLGDGSTLARVGATIVGRNPVVSDAAPNGTALVLADPAKSLSKTHALLVPEPDYVMVTDLHSTNGVAAIDAAGAVTVLEPGRSAPVGAGSTLRLGEVVVSLRRD
jgi:hypothetical protein